MRFLGTATIVGLIVLIILTIWIWFVFGTRAHAWADNRRPTPWGWQCSRCPYGHPGRIPRGFQAPPTGSYQEYGGSEEELPARRRF